VVGRRERRSDPACQNSPWLSGIGAKEGRKKVTYPETALGAAWHDARGSGWPDVEKSWRWRAPTYAGERLSVDQAEELRKGETTTGSRCARSGEAHRGQSAGRSPTATAKRRSNNGGVLRLGECEGRESANVRQGRAEGVCGVFT
jgi:hypothetical protein